MDNGIHHHNEINGYEDHHQAQVDPFFAALEYS
jgi:hypothetical protein